MKQVQSICFLELKGFKAPFLSLIALVLVWDPTVDPLEPCDSINYAIREPQKIMLPHLRNSQQVGWIKQRQVRQCKQVGARANVKARTSLLRSLHIAPPSVPVYSSVIHPCRTSEYLFQGSLRTSSCPVSENCTVNSLSWLFTLTQNKSGCGATRFRNKVWHVLRGDNCCKEFRMIFGFIAVLHTFLQNRKESLFLVPSQSWNKFPVQVAVFRKEHIPTTFLRLDCVVTVMLHLHILLKCCAG